MSIEDRMRLLVVAVDAVRVHADETAVGSVVAGGATSVLCHGGLRYFARPEVRR